MRILKNQRTLAEAQEAIGKANLLGFKLAERRGDAERRGKVGGSVMRNNADNNPFSFSSSASPPLREE